ncbi:MAG: hypothetical protein WBA98_17285 [Gordonia sp. (in: high G+C Gram-positive bacteria)]|uniref:hypothetical protein n=2 Tax=Gordonia sp. (in: high G+C Gram-positive bacteria) TaxID=84139 RepID=UPI003C721B0F
MNRLPMIRLGRIVVPAATAAVLASGVVACGTDQGSNDRSRPNAPRVNTMTKKLPDTDCTAPAHTGRIARSGYGLRYGHGTMNVSIAPVGGKAQCVQFSKSGSTDPNVPGDAMLFTFTGNRGEGALLEFLAVDLAGGVLPWPPGASARVPGSPITSTVGVSLDGTYFTSNVCTLTVTAANAAVAAGRFDCPNALAQTANPLDPSDDVSYDDPPAGPPPPAAKMSGTFLIKK